MKSSNAQLRCRGFVSADDIYLYNNLDKNELLDLLGSDEPHVRTAAVSLISSRYGLDRQTTRLFCNMLQHETKLYTKIELCGALSKASADCADIMVLYLGKIGNNQYRELPDQEFHKKSYPLPRDIIARTLAHMSADVLPVLTGVLHTDNRTAIREAIDAIGFLCFYHRDSDHETVVSGLIACLDQFAQDSMIRWKVIRSFQCFNCAIVKERLERIMKNDDELMIRNEAKRSLGIMSRKLA